MHDQPETTEAAALSTPWAKLSVAVAIIALLASLAGGLIVHETDSSAVNQRQNDRIDDLDRRITKLEQIAQINSEARIRTEEQLTAIFKQHEQMIVDLKSIQTMLELHERESKKSGIH